MDDIKLTYWGCWGAALIGGAIGYELVPEAFQYITAFATGTLSFMFLQLARSK